MGLDLKRASFFVVVVGFLVHYTYPKFTGVPPDGRGGGGGVRTLLEVVKIGTRITVASP